MRIDGDGKEGANAMRQMNLEEIQLCCIEILRAFDKHCANNGLKYWLIGGSTLGAIRHGGIIPWDDDIDVGMPRVDYERFCSSYQDNDDYALVAFGKNDGYYNPFAKLCDKRTLFVEPTSANTPHGVFIDIFPIDYVCDSDDAIRKAMNEKRLYNHAFVVNLEADEFKSESFPKRLARKVFRSRRSKDSPSRLSEAITSSIASSEPTARMMNIWGAWGLREVMDAEWFGEGVRKPFADMECLIPTEWDKYLTKLYGDYMTPPKEPPHYHGHAYALDE